MEWRYSSWTASSCARRRRARNTFPCWKWLQHKVGGGATLQQDITAEQRMGYLAAREYGTLFVENRYTDFGSYYPHRTLRNLWMLARFCRGPADAVRSCLNPARNTERYRAEPLAPGRYTADYLFASVMAAQPLLWMELSGLGRQDAARLQRGLIGVYRLHREAMWACDVRPVGQEPDGRSFTGFAFTSPCGQKGYLLLFRENVPESAFTFTRMPRKGPAAPAVCKRPGWAGIHARRRPVPAFCSPAHLCVLSVADIKRRPKRRTKNGRACTPCRF